MAGPDDDGVIRTEVDGVPTFWAPCPGPLRAALSFRVGQADETYLTAGTSHLVEHLALFGIEDAARHHNGFVDQTMTVFHTHGDGTAVVDFMAAVCGQLTALPTGRLDQERDVLAAERAGQSVGPVRLLSVWRFGARGHGLIGTQRVGEQVAGAAAVQAWADERFTRDNAVLWLSGPPPAGLRLPLRPGRPMPAPEPSSIVTGLPGWFCEDVGGIAVSAIVRRGSAASLLQFLLDEQLRTVLRTDNAISYSPWVSYERYTGERAHLVAFADSPEQRRKELSSRFADVLAGLTTMDDAAAAAGRQQLITQLRTATEQQPDDLRLSRVVLSAHDLLHARVHTTVAQELDELAALSPEAVRALAQEVRGDALYVLPGAAEVASGRFGTLVPGCATRPVTGRGRRHRDSPVIAHRLVGTAEGVTRRFGPAATDQLTVRYADLVGALRYPDGALTLVGTDAVHLTIEPTLWHGGDRMVAEALGHAGPARTVTLPARPPDAVPKPSTTPWQRLVATARGPSAWFYVSCLILVGVVVAAIPMDRPYLAIAASAGLVARVVRHVREQRSGAPPG